MISTRRKNFAKVASHIGMMILFIFMLTFFSCEKKNEESDMKALFQIVENKPEPVFSGDSAYALVKKQVDFGPRAPQTLPHSLTAAFLESYLRQYADQVEIQQFVEMSYENQPMNLQNIIAKFNPSSPNRIMLCAHWDSRPWADQEKDTTLHIKPIPGANDGASGTGILLEIARLLKSQKVNYGIDIVLFDGEDYGKSHDLARFCLGSKYFGAHKGNYAPAYVILLDLVGDKDAIFRIEKQSQNFADDIVSIVWNTAAKVSSTRFINQVDVEIYDDHIPLQQAGLKAIDIIDASLVGGDPTSARRKYWHTLNDTMDNIDAKTLEEVGKVLVRLIYSLQFAV